MFRNRTVFIVVTLLAVPALFASGCTTLVKDDIRQPLVNAPHCSGQEWADDSSLAVLPIPVVAFVVPHWDIHEIKADEYLKRCGDTTRLVNREVEVSRVACVPAALTRIISLGIWQWCPARVEWSADLKPPSAAQEPASAKPAANTSRAP